jgi:DNA-binding transcriptional LysR family regulator
MTRVSSHALGDLRVADLLTFLAVQRTGSLSVAARELGVTRSQVSKAIARLEAHWRTSLLVRGARGVTLSDAGRRLTPHVTTAVRELRASTRASSGAGAIALRVAGPTYLIAYLVPAIAHSLPDLSVHALEVPPAYIRAHLDDGVFDMAIVPSGADARPAAWTSDRIGSLRKALFGAPALAKKLAPLPTTHERVRSIGFVGALSTPGEHFVAIGDDCPLPPDDRIIAHEVQTIGTALELAAAGSHVVFGPVVAARRLTSARALVEIPVKGWDVHEPLFLLCNGDSVLTRMRDAVLRAVTASMVETGAR